VKLVLLETECMPLLSPDNFDKWAKGGSEDKWNEMKERLYPRSLARGGSASNTDVPSGLVALCSLMTSTRKDIVGPSRFISDELGDLIGFGSFAAVYSHKNDTSLVIKLSRYGAKAGLEREAAVLKHLLEPSAPGIARFVDFKSLEINIGGVDVLLPALTTGPRGVSIQMHLAAITILDKKKKELLSIGEELSCALKFIHEKGIYHNDISRTLCTVQIKARQKCF
jgi:serine/threonine protein kinase